MCGIKIAPSSIISFGGTALPINSLQAVRLGTTANVNQSGKNWSRAASRGVSVRRFTGWTYRPWPIELKPVVIVWAGSSHLSRPYTDL